jgi:transketolase
MSESKVIFSFTHDSVGLGEDGPTHQPIEHIASLRAMPMLQVIRPADANETVLAWKFALEQATRPTAFALSRQGLPVIPPADIPVDAIERGAYVLRDADGDADVVLIGTGSEVSLCVKAAEALAGDGIAARVVSMPCVENFLAQADAYRDSVVPSGLAARVVVEAASPLGWERLAGPHGEIVAMTSFGTSAPAGDAFKHFGFTPERVAEAARTTIERAA